MSTDLSPDMLATYKVAYEVIHERRQQDIKWGVQNHPDGTDERYSQWRDAMREECNAAAARGEVTWRHIAYEEMTEAFAEEDPALLRAELVQTAAVLVAWVEAIDRRGT